MNKFKIISSYPQREEMEMSQEEELRRVLHDLAKHGNSIVLLKYPGIGNLTLGIGMHYGFVEFMNADESPPYLIAKEDHKKEDVNPFVEFDSGGTPTPIPIDNCLPFDRVVEIAVYFLRNKKLPDYVNWIGVE